MTFVALFLSATKLAGILVSLTVAANAVSFARYRRKNLRPFHSPIDESAEVLADFTSVPASGNKLLRLVLEVCLNSPYLLFSVKLDSATMDF